MSPPLPTVVGEQKGWLRAFGDEALGDGLFAVIGSGRELRLSCAAFVPFRDIRPIARQGAPA